SRHPRRRRQSRRAARSARRRGAARRSGAAGRDRRRDSAAAVGRGAGRRLPRARTRARARVQLGRDGRARPRCLPARMRIGIDARELCGHATGVGRYLSGLLREWSRSPRARAHEFVLYAPETPPLALDTRQFAMRTVRGAGGTWWEQVQAPRAAAGDRLDAWFAPAYTAPLAIDVPVTLVVHDVSFFAHPEWFRVREGVRRRWLTRHSVARAAAIITVSQFSKRELMEWLDVPADKITVVRSGIESDRWTSDAGSPSGAAQASQPRVLFVGSLFTRRHVGDLIRAFAPIARARADACLDIVGDNRTYPVEDIRATIRAEQIEAQVAWHHYVSDDRLRALYAAARAFAFLSEYEGMGFTP